MSILVTRNSEYRIENEVCTAVRPNSADAWVTHHPAVGQKLLGAVRMGTRFAFAKWPTVGMHAIFENDIVTSPLVDLKAF